MENNASARTIRQRKMRLNFVIMIRLSQADFPKARIWPRY
jgi:hypothetical protein